MYLDKHNRVVYIKDHEQILSVECHEDGTVTISEECDTYFSTRITANEAIALFTEIIDHIVSYRD